MFGFQGKIKNFQHKLLLRNQKIMGKFIAPVAKRLGNAAAGVPSFNNEPKNTLNS